MVGHRTRESRSRSASPRTDCDVFADGSYGWPIVMRGPTSDRNGQDPWHIHPLAPASFRIAGDEVDGHSSASVGPTPPLIFTQTRLSPSPFASRTAFDFSKMQSQLTSTAPFTISSLDLCVRIQFRLASRRRFLGPARIDHAICSRVSR